MRCVEVHGSLVGDGEVLWTAELEDDISTQTTSWRLPVGAACPVRLGEVYEAKLRRIAPERKEG